VEKEGPESALMHELWVCHLFFWLLGMHDNDQLAHVVHKEPAPRALLVDFGVDVENWKPKDSSLFLLFFPVSVYNSLVAVAAAFFAVAVSHRSRFFYSRCSHFFT
jgi:uncharacterized membrane protein